MTRLKRVLTTTAVLLTAGFAGAVPAGAVTGGADADLPFVAQVSIGDTQRACTGSLVHPQLVLTGKACFGDSAADGAPAVATTVTVGGATVAVREITVHSGRNLALARLDTPVTAVAPVAIATAAPAQGDTLTVAGFGRTTTQWRPGSLKAMTATVTAVGTSTVSIGSGGVCRGDAGGPALTGSGTSARLVAVHHTSNQAGCLGESTGTPEATETRVDDIRSWVIDRFPSFRSGFESGDARMNWHNSVGTGAGHGGAVNVGGVCCSLTGAELFRGTDSRAHGGTGVVLYSGKDTNASRSFSYTRAFRLNNVQVRPSTVLSYWIYPQSKANSFQYAEGNNSTCVAVDLVYTDGTSMRDSGAVDQRGNRAHPAWQCEKVALDTWSEVVVQLGQWSAGKTIQTVSIGYDQAANTGGYRGFVDDIAITDVIRTDRFATGVESGQPGQTWSNTLSSTAPGGGAVNVSGICCSLTGAELKTVQATEIKARTGVNAILYSGKDTSTSRSFAYSKAFALSETYVTPDTRLSYWIYPQSKTDSGMADGSNSTCVGVDLLLTDQLDGTSKALRDLGAKDQRGNSAHPGGQCGKLTMGAWNYVSVPLGAVANGRQITQIDVGYDQYPNTGGYRGYIDDVRITD